MEHHSVFWDMLMYGDNPPCYDADGIMQKFIDHPLQMIIIMIFAMGFGFVEYVYCAIMTRRDKISPFPTVMHTYYLAHDFLFVLLFYQWFCVYKVVVFEIVWAGMVAFNAFEVYSLHAALKNQRQHDFGAFFTKPVSYKQGFWVVAAMVIVSFTILNTARTFLSDRIMFDVFISTNVLMAIAPAVLMFKERKRRKGSVGLAFFIVCGTIATFLPEGAGLYTTSDPAYFQRPWFFILGAVCLLIALAHLIFVLKLPKYSPNESDLMSMSKTV